MKEWNFEKNLPANEMAFIAAKVDKRKFEEGKDTNFFRGNIKIEAGRIENFKKRKLTVTDMVDLPILVGMWVRFLVIASQTDDNRHTRKYDVPHPCSST